MNKLFYFLVISSMAASALADDQFSLGTGFNYSTGKYGGATSTDILYIPVTAKYETDDLTLKLTVPYLKVTSAGGVLRGMGRIGSVLPPRAVMTTNAGLGDVVASAGYNIYDNNALAFDLVGKLKLGTANANKGLGTGKDDYSAQLDSYYTIDKTSFFATAGYTVVGVPTGLMLNNIAYGTLGADQKLDDETNTGIMLDAAQRISPTATAPIEATAYVSKKLGNGLKAQANVLKGFSHGSPDFGFGATISKNF